MGDTEAKNSVVEWVKSISGEEDLTEENFIESLKTGVVLIDVVNEIFPKQITGYSKNPNSEYQCMDNISIFLEAIRELGVSEAELFDTTDLYNEEDDIIVVNTLLSFGRLVQEIAPDFPGPKLGKKDVTRGSTSKKEYKFNPNAAVSKLNQGSSKQMQRSPMGMHGQDFAVYGDKEPDDKILNPTWYSEEKKENEKEIIKEKPETKTIMVKKKRKVIKGAPIKLKLKVGKTRPVTEMVAGYTFKILDDGESDLFEEIGELFTQECGKQLSCTHGLPYGGTKKSLVTLQKLGGSIAVLFEEGTNNIASAVAYKNESTDIMPSGGCFGCCGIFNVSRNEFRGGLARLKAKNLDFDTADSLEIIAFATHAEHRQKGLNSMLMGSVLDLAESEGEKTLLVVTDPDVNRWAIDVGFKSIGKVNMGSGYKIWLMVSLESMNENHPLFNEETKKRAIEKLKKEQGITDADTNPKPKNTIKQPLIPRVSEALEEKEDSEEEEEEEEEDPSDAESSSYEVEEDSEEEELPVPDM